MKYSVLVKPGSKVEKIVEENNALTIFVHARAHDNEANKAVQEKLAKHFSVSKSQVSIISGQKSKKKIVEIIS